MKQVRKAYWDKSKDMIEYCTLDELKVLGQQVSKAMETRIEEYLGKFKVDEHERKLIKQARVKIKARRHSKGL